MAKRTTTRWTEADLETLKAKYGSIPNEELSREIGRSKQSIQHAAHRTGLTTVKVATKKHCLECGEELSRAAQYRSNTNRCRECADKKHSGEGHHNWKGGVAALRSIVHVMLKPVWIDPILRKARFTCQICGKRGGDMNVHHIYPYRVIRDEVTRSNPGISTTTFEGKKALALKIVEAHKLSYGIVLCVLCHAKVHNETRGELLETPTASGEDNQQPSRSNVIAIVDRKVQRLTGEDSQTDKPDTSAPHPSLEGDDIVWTCGKP